MENVKISNSKGKYIAAVIHRPKNKTERLAILCPGYLDSKDYNHLIALADTLAKNGYTAVRFDPTGTWESEGTALDCTVSQYLEDVRSVLEFMLGAEAYNFILLGGHSVGGMISILYAARDSRISAVSAIMSPSSFSPEGALKEKWRTSGIRISRRDVPGQTEEKEFRVPYAFALDGYQYQALEDVKKLRIPVVFVAGEMDKIIPPEIVEEIFRGANEPKKYLLLPGISHGYRRNLSEVKMVTDKIIEVLRQESIVL